MVRFVIAGVAFTCAFAAPIAGSYQVVTMQGGAPPPATTAQTAPKGTGLVVGQVVDAETGRPIPGATVQFTSNLPATPEELIPGTLPQVRRVIANGEGRFMFHSVPPGRISLFASAASYIGASPGQRRPQGPSPPLVLADDERVASVVIKMWKYASIEGRVVDEHNEPAVGIQVRTWRRDWSGGRVRMTPGLFVNTDDRGAFRIGQLMPGDYYVSVPSTQLTMPVSVAKAYADLVDSGRGASTQLSRQLSSSGAPIAGAGGQRVGDHILQVGRGAVGLPLPAGETGRLLVYPMAFEPSLDQDPIRLNSGAQRQGVAIALRPVAGVKVSGILTGPDGPVANVGVQLIQSRVFGTMSLQGTETARTATDANGAFTFLGVPADKYKLSVLYAPRPASSGDVTIINSGSSTTVMTMGSGSPAPLPTEPTLFAEMDLTVGDEDLAGLSVPVRHGARVSGTVVFDGVATAPTPEQIAQISINVRPVTGGFMFSLTPGRVDPDLRIRTVGYPAGRYFLTAFVPAPGWSLASATLGSRDVSRSGIEIGDTDITNLVLTFTDKRTEIAGTVRSRASTGDPDAVVVAIPSNVREWIADGMNTSVMRTARTSPNGAYSVSGLPPGEYRVLAMSDDFAVDARDPAFLERLVQLGTSIALREGEKRTLDLRTETPPRRAPAPETPLAPAPASTASAWPEPLDRPEAGGPFVADLPQAIQQAPARDVTSIAARGTGVITGMVVTSDTDKKPIRKAQVMLLGSALRPSPVVVTDDAGRFLFRDVPPGRYTLQASRPSYVETAYGSPRPGRAGTILALAEGQHLTDLTIPMMRGAVIEGTVLNELGLPEERAQITLLQQRPGPDGPQLASSGISLFATTDDRGRYRVFGLAPGEYFVAVRAGFSFGSDLTRITDADMRWANAALKPGPTSSSPPPSSPPIALVPVFHPGVTELANARVIKLAEAEERTGVDINLITVTAARVEGRVVTADGQRPAQLQVTMLPEGPRVPLVSPPIFVRPTADGSFQVQGVAPGRYVISARAASRTAGVAAVPPSGGRAGGPTLDLWAMETVEVNGQDVTGISMTLAPGLNVRGRVVFDAATATPPERFGGVQVAIRPVSTTGVALGVSPAAVSEDGTFTIPGVTPNAYRVTANAPGRTAQGLTWMLKSIVAGGRDISDAPLAVTPDADVVDLVVTMTDRVTEITGLLLDSAGRPAPELTILVFPTDKAQWGRDSRRRPPSTRPGTDGRYRLTGVPPGEYFIVAVSEMAPEEMYDTGLLESLIPSAMKLSLAEGEKKTQDFKLAGR